MKPDDFDDFEKRLRRSRRWSIGLVTLLLGLFSLSIGVLIALMLPQILETGDAFRHRAVSAAICMILLGVFLAVQGVIVLYKSE